MFSCLEGIRMRIKERNRKQMYDKQKRRYNSQRKKFTGLFKILLITFLAFKNKC